MDSQIATIVIVLTILAAAIAAPVVTFMWWREKRKRIALEEEVSVARGVGERAVEIGKKFLAEKNALAAKVAQMEQRFRPVVDLDAECAVLNDKIALWTSETSQLRASYQEKKAVYDRLLKEVAVFDEKLAFAEMGVYEPHFDFTDSEEYKRNISATREAEKVMVSAKAAVICTTNWTVDGSAAKGQTMTNRNIRLTLRAFNSECDAAIANARWNNINAMEKRILNAHAQIDKHNASNSVFITNEYLKLKLQELYLTHEYREKVKAERDERAEAARL